MSRYVPTIRYKSPTDNPTMINMVHMLADAGCTWESTRARSGKIFLRYKDAEGHRCRFVFPVKGWAKATVNLGKIIGVEAPPLIARYAATPKGAPRSASSRNRSLGFGGPVQMAASAPRSSVTQRNRARMFRLKLEPL